MDLHQVREQTWELLRGRTFPDRGNGNRKGPRAEKMPVLRTITEANVLLAGGVNELVVSEVQM